MTFDLSALTDVAKDKIGRKHILGLADIGCLTYLISQGHTELWPLCIVASVGVIAIAAQLAIDWKYPRMNGAAKPPNEP